MGKFVVQDHMLGKYASLYAKRAVHQLQDLDVWFEADVLDDLAWCSFQEGVDLSEGLPPDPTEEDYTGEKIQIPRAKKDESDKEQAKDELDEWHMRVDDLRRSA